jgi:hypothetical protein
MKMNAREIVGVISMVLWVLMWLVFMLGGLRRKP